MLCDSASVLSTRDAPNFDKADATIHEDHPKVGVERRQRLRELP